MQNREMSSAYLERARDAIDRGQDMVKNLLDFSSGTPIDVVPLDLGKAIKDTTRLLKKDSDNEIKVSIEIAPGLWNVYGNRSQYQQIIINLYQNAVDAINETIEKNGKKRD